MVSPISDMVLRKGVANVDFSKLQPELRMKVLEEVGQAQMKRGNHEEAGKAYALLSTTHLREMTRYFLNHGMPATAAQYARHLDDASIVEGVAAACLNTGAKEEAKRLYRRARNEAMVRFIEENF